MAELLSMKFDDVLKNLTGQAGSLEGLLGVFFSFLHRNTDFYVTFDPATTTRPGMGFPPGKAEQLLLRAFNSLPFKQYGGQQQQQQPRSGTGTGKGAGRGAAPAATPHSRSSAAAAPSTSRAVGQGGKPRAASASHTPGVVGKSSTSTSTSKPGEVVEVVDGEPRTPTPQQQEQQRQQAPSGSGGKGSESSPNATCGEGAGPRSSLPTAPSPQAVTSATPGASDSNNTRVRYTDSGKQVPIGNGGVTPKYYWTQTVSEATVYVDVPPGTRSKDVSCRIQPRRLKLRVRGAGATASTTAVTSTATAAPAAPNRSAGAAAPDDGEDVIIDGELPSAVSREGSMWSLNDGKTVVISFEKATRTWWKSVVEGDPEIDTSKVSHCCIMLYRYDTQDEGSLYFPTLLRNILQLFRVEAPACRQCLRGLRYGRRRLEGGDHIIFLFS